MITILLTFTLVSKAKASSHGMHLMSLDGIEKIKANLKWEKHPRGGWIGFFKIFFNTTNSSTIDANIKR